LGLFGGGAGWKTVVFDGIKASSYEGGGGRKESDVEGGAEGLGGREEEADKAGSSVGGEVNE